MGIIHRSSSHKHLQTKHVVGCHCSRLLTFSSLQSVSGKFEITGTNTVSGSAEFQQNPLTGNNSKYSFYLNGSGVMPNMKYKIGVGSACSATPTTTLVEVTSPMFMLNGFYVKGTDTVVAEMSGMNANKTSAN